MFNKKVETYKVSDIVTITVGTVRKTGTYEYYIANCISVIYEIEKSKSEHSCVKKKMKRFEEEHDTELKEFNYTLPNQITCVREARQIIKYLRLPIVINMPETKKEEVKKMIGK